MSFDLDNTGELCKHLNHCSQTTAVKQSTTIQEESMNSTRTTPYILCSVIVLWCKIDTRMNVFCLTNVIWDRMAMQRQLQVQLLQHTNWCDLTTLWWDNMEKEMALDWMLLWYNWCFRIVTSFELEWHCYPTDQRHHNIA